MLFFSRPSNDRNWSTDQKVLPTAEISGNKVLLRNIRHFKYRSAQDYDPCYYDKEFNLDLIERVELGIVPFSRNPLIVHTLIVFNFSNGDHVVFSVEVRKQRGQKFVTWKTALNFYELMYVIADREDVIDLREKYRKNEPVHLHEIKISKEKIQQLFLGLCKRADHLSGNPEFFNLFFNSCGSNVADHLNEILPKKINWFYKYFAPGLLVKHLEKRGEID